METSTHIDLVLASEVAAGRQPVHTKVGLLRMRNRITNKAEFMNGYVHFELDGTPRYDERGQLRINWRAQR